MKKRIRQFIQKSFSKINLKQFGLFFTAAFLFLMITKFSESSTKNLEFRIEVTDIPVDIQLRKDSLRVLKLRASSTGFGFFYWSLNGPKSVNLSATKDLEKLKDSSYRWTLGEADINLRSKLPEAFDLIAAQPDTLIFKFDQLASRIVPVDINSEINFALGYDLLGALSLSKDSIEIIGPKPMIDSITSIRTNLLQLSGVKENISVEIGLQNPLLEGLSIADNKVKVLGEVRRFTEGEIRVPVTVVNVPSKVKINYFPKEVTLNYYVDLDNFKNITAEDFQVECNFTEHEESGLFHLTPLLKINSDRVKSARINTKKVEFIFL